MLSGLDEEDRSDQVVPIRNATLLRWPACLPDSDRPVARLPVHRFADGRPVQCQELLRMRQRRVLAGLSEHIEVSHSFCYGAGVSVGDGVSVGVAL